jgi:DNA-binding MarR family transcriptional regulator
MSGIDEDVPMALSVSIILMEYAKMTDRPFSEVVAQYPILLGPEPTDLMGKIRYYESVERLFGDLATFYSEPVFEGKENQRKLLIFRYFSKRDCATSFNVSSDMKLSLTNASERLRRYYKQGLLTREALVRKRRGRRIMVYRLTEAGLKRLAFLEKNVRFEKAETDLSKKYRIRQSGMKNIVMALRLRLASS